MIQLRLEFEKDQVGGKYPVIYVSRGIDWSQYFKAEEPAKVTFLYSGNPYIERSGNYSEVSQTGDAYIAVAEMDGPGGSRVRVEDHWSMVHNINIELSRKITVLKAGDVDGIRGSFMISTSFEDGVDVREFEYLAPGAFYRHLDTDGDGVPDNYQTYNLAWSEDKLAFPAVMGFHPEKKFYVSLYRVDVAEHDSSVLEKVWEGKRFFNLETDLGSLGFQYDDGQMPTQMKFRAYYPFYEGEVSYALDRKGYPWGVYKEAKDGAVLECTHRIRINDSASFANACWDLYGHLINVYEPKHIELKYSFEEVNKYRVEFLNQFFYEFNEQEDSRRPAGYIVNQHPLEGRTLGHVYEYGFSGKQLMNAYVSMRYGYDNNLPQYIEDAKKAIRFFREEVVQDNGFCHGVYSADEHTFVPWFSGILLPYSFARTREEQEKYLGKETVEGLATITEELKQVYGAFTRPMSEEGFSLLTCWELEKEKGNDYPEWVQTAEKIGDFFLRIQNKDGSWYRAVDFVGEPVKVPEAWFGRSEDMRKSTTYNVVTFMVKLYQVTARQEYLDAAIRGGDFTIEKYVNTSYMYGTLLDHPFNGAMRATGPIMDNVSPMFAMEALLDLYETTKQQRFLDGAVTAAQISATWVNLWDVPWPEGTTLSKFKFRSTGWSPVNVYCTSFQTDLYPIYFIKDFAKIAEYTGDKNYLLVAKLLQYAMNDMVSTPKETYGYAHYGLQNEGRVMTWFFVKEWAKPTEGAKGSFEFAGRGKGEENKTAYGWMYAIPLGAYYRFIDEYQTIDFDALEKKLF